MVGLGLTTPPVKLSTEELLLHAIAEETKVSDGQGENNITLQYKITLFYCNEYCNLRSHYSQKVRYSYCL